MILETERLTLRPIAVSDANAVFRIMSDPEVMARWDTAEIEDPDVVAGIVEARVRDAEAGQAFYWVLVQDGFVVGLCDLSAIDRKKRTAELGFALNQEAWGRGFAAEAMGAVLAHAASLGLRRLTARAHVGNERSETLLAQLGFKPEGYLRGHIHRGGVRRDHRIYALTL